MIVKLPTEHHLEFLSLKGGCRGSSGQFWRLWYSLLEDKQFYQNDFRFIYLDILREKSLAIIYNGVSHR